MRLDPASVVTTLSSSLPLTMRSPSAAAHSAHLAVRLGEHQRLFAEHEDRGSPEKVNGDDRASRRDQSGALHDGDGIGAGVGHGLQRLEPPIPQGGSIKQYS